jgi:hypothetical protein
MSKTSNSKFYDYLHEKISEELDQYSCFEGWSLELDDIQDDCETYYLEVKNTDNNFNIYFCVKDDDERTIELYSSSESWETYDSHSYYTVNLWREILSQVRK